MRKLRIIKDISFNFWVNQIACSPILPQKARIAIYKLHGMDLDKCGIYSGQYFCGPNVKIGKGSFVNHKCFFENTLSAIEIGDNCNIAMEVMFCTATHEMGDIKKELDCL